MPSVFRERDTWDPKMILSQMVLMQTGFYLVTGAWLVLCSGIFGFTPQLKLLLDSSVFAAFDSLGWSVILASLLTAPVCSFLLLIFISRAKKCMDFAITMYVFHAVLCVCYAGFPNEWAFWTINTIACIGAIVFGEYLCWRKEMQEIPLVGQAASKAHVSPRIV